MKIKKSTSWKTFKKNQPAYSNKKDRKKAEVPPPLKKTVELNFSESWKDTEERNLESTLITNNSAIFWRPNMLYFLTKAGVTTESFINKPQIRRLFQMHFWDTNVIMFIFQFICTISIQAARNPRRTTEKIFFRHSFIFQTTKFIIFHTNRSQMTVYTLHYIYFFFCNKKSRTVHIKPSIKKYIDTAQ